VLGGCPGELEALDSTLHVFGGRLSEGPSPPRGAPGRAVIIVKSLSPPSVDETPIVEAVLGALEASGVYRVEVYEYEPLWGRPGRGRRAAELIKKALSEGAALVALAPALMAVDLASRLPWEAIEALEEGLLARIEVDYESLLYLPDSGSVTLLAKANSASSYERVEWLRRRASSVGVEVERVIYLEDNAAILRALRGQSPGWYRRLVPVTKLARILLAALRCREIPGIVEFRRRERAEHTLYAVNLDPDTAAAILYSLRARLSRPHKPMPPRNPRVRQLYLHGIERAVGEALSILRGASAPF
jgi:hypothetical protein